MDPLFSEEKRLASFKPVGSSRRRHTKAADSALPPQWPHPFTTRKDKASAIPVPALLAKYGFYFAPSDDAVDSASHFLYQISLSGWKPGDDPLERLEQELPGNKWCKIWRSEASGKFQDNGEGIEQWTWSDENLLPNSKQMCEARKETFARRWPYDGKKGWKPTSKKLADAGFHFTPTEDEPDSATCIYCNKGLGGWEKGDDPVHEHKKREPDCAFFTCRLVVEQTDDAHALGGSLANEPVDEVAEDVRGDEEAEATNSKPSRKTKRVASTSQKRSASASKGSKTIKPQAVKDERASDGENEVEASASEAVGRKASTRRAVSSRARSKGKHSEQDVGTNDVQVEQTRPEKVETTQGDVQADNGPDGTIIEHSSAETSDDEEGNDNAEPEVELESEEEIAQSKKKAKATKTSTTSADAQDPPKKGKKGSTKGKTALAASNEAKQADEIDLLGSQSGPDSEMKGAAEPTSQEAGLQTATDRSSSLIRSPLTQLQLLNNLDLSEKERSLDLGRWLQVKADEAAEEMRLQGEKQIMELQQRMAEGRQTIERTLRGRS